MKLTAFLYKWYKLSTLKLDKNDLRNNYEYVFIRLQLEDCWIGALGQILPLPSGTQFHNNAPEHVMAIEFQYLENSNSFQFLLHKTEPFLESTCILKKVLFLFFYLASDLAPPRVSAPQTGSVSELTFSSRQSILFQLQYALNRGLALLLLYVSHNLSSSLSLLASIL